MDILSKIGNPAFGRYLVPENFPFVTCSQDMTMEEETEFHRELWPGLFEGDKC